MPNVVGHFWITFKPAEPYTEEDYVSEINHRYHFDVYDDGVIVPDYHVKENVDRDQPELFAKFLADPLLHCCTFYPPTPIVTQEDCDLTLSEGDVQYLERPKRKKKE